MYGREPEGRDDAKVLLETARIPEAVMNHFLPL
jgi:hypothetical protein